MRLIAFELTPRLFSGLARVTLPWASNFSNKDLFPAGTWSRSASGFLNCDGAAVRATRAFKRRGRRAPLAGGRDSPGAAPNVRARLSAGDRAGGRAVGPLTFARTCRGSVAHRSGPVATARVV